MNVEEAFELSERGFGSALGKILATEVKRLREQRRLLCEEMSGYKVFSVDAKNIWEEVQKEEKKMTVDQAIRNIEQLGPYTSREVSTLIAEIKRLREFDNERASVIKEKNEEIKYLQEDIKIKDELWKENRKKLGREVRDVLESYRV